MKYPECAVTTRLRLVAELLEAVESGSANGALLALARYTAGSKAAFRLNASQVQYIGRFR